jgi:hypothetical protein
MQSVFTINIDIYMHFLWLDDKRYISILDDGISSLAYGHWKI